MRHYQRGPDGWPLGKPVDELFKQAYGPIPAATHFQHPSCRFEEPVEIIGWDWSTTFHRWGAYVVFADGWRGFTWPKTS